MHPQATVKAHHIAGRCTLAVAVVLAALITAGGSRSVSAQSLPACSFTYNGTIKTLVEDCVTFATIGVEDGYTLDGNGHTITAMDPPGDHYRGAIIANLGTRAYVTNVTVTTSGLATVCDGGSDRLRGILFDGASGSITNAAAINIRQGPDGCQEGNAIEARNAPFDATGPDVPVTISGNSVSGYQKTGIVANGSVAATISGNTVSGLGPVDFIAQNGIQVGFGATAVIDGNTVSGNDYTPDSYVSCGLLVYEADGVHKPRNSFSSNERNFCNYGRGGGQVNPDF